MLNVTDDKNNTENRSYYTDTSPRQGGNGKHNSGEQMDKSRSNTGKYQRKIEEGHGEGDEEARMEEVER